MSVYDKDVYSLALPYTYYGELETSLVPFKYLLQYILGHKAKRKVAFGQLSVKSKLQQQISLPRDDKVLIYKCTIMKTPKRTYSQVLSSERG